MSYPTKQSASSIGIPKLSCFKCIITLCEQLCMLQLLCLVGQKKEEMLFVDVRIGGRRRRKKRKVGTRRRRRYPDEKFSGQSQICRSYNSRYVGIHSVASSSSSCLLIGWLVGSFISRKEKNIDIAAVIYYIFSFSYFSPICLVITSVQDTFGQEIPLLICTGSTSTTNNIFALHI